MALDSRAQAAEILSLAVTAGDEHGRAPDAFERSEGRRDGGRLGIVHEQHAADVGDAFHAMRQPLKCGERGQHVVVDFANRGGERQRRERIQRIMPADERKLARGKHAGAAVSEPRRIAVHVDQPPVVLGRGHVAAERLHGASGYAHRE